MARYPFREKAEELLQQKSVNCSEVTIKNLRRRYAKQEREIIALYEKGLVSTLSPGRFTAEDMKEYLKFRLAQGKSASDQSHDISALNQLCLYCGNPAVRMCLDRYPELKPRKSYDGRLDPMPKETVDLIIRRSAEIDRFDYKEVRAYCLVVMYVTTGARNKELRLAELQDLDTVAWRLTIRHPKGEGTYGMIRTVPVPEQARPIIRSYLNVRDAWLRIHKTDSPMLFFSQEEGHGPLSTNSIRRIKTIVEKDIGRRFELRDCRRAFGQNYLDLGLDLEDVSILMGHFTTRTTEQYYCRRNEEMAIRAAESIMKEQAGVASDEADPDDSDEHPEGSREDTAPAKRMRRNRRRSKVGRHSGKACRTSQRQPKTMIEQ